MLNIDMYCCQTFQNAFSRKDIDRHGNERSISFYIYGRPRIANDGDGYFDDMTSDYEIAYCPFCGQKLSGVVGGTHEETTPH